MLPEAQLLYGHSSQYRNLAPGSTGSVVKASACEIHAIVVGNTDTNNVYLKIYNKATAPSSSDTPVLTLPVIKGTSLAMTFDDPIYCATGVGIRVVQDQADNGTTAPTAASCTLNILYK